MAPTPVPILPIVPNSGQPRIPAPVLNVLIVLILAARHRLGPSAGTQPPPL